MTTLEPLVLICPKCRLLFVSTKVTSCGHANKDTDFHPDYWGVNPLPYFINRCPKCKFVAFKNDFEIPDQRLLEKEKKNLPSDPDDSGIKRYAEAASYYISKEENKLFIADLYLRAGWCARVEEKAADEKAMLTEATLWFTKALDEKVVISDQRAIITYLVGELYRRCGRLDTSKEFFERAKTEPMKREEKKWLPHTIKRQLTLTHLKDSHNTQFSDE
jgi:uncharacterized protein (DUF2225 family)